MLPITSTYVILIIAIEMTNWSRSTPSNITWTMSRFYVIFTYQYIIISSLFVHAFDPGFHIPSSVMRYISSFAANVASDGFDNGNYKNTPRRNNVMHMSKSGKYILWSSTDGSMAWIFVVSLTIRPTSLMMNGIIGLLYLVDTDKELPKTST